MGIREEIARRLAEWRSGEHAEPWEVDMYMDAAEAVMPVVQRAQAGALRNYRERLLEQNIDRFGVVLPDLHEVLDDLDEEADRIEKEAGEHD